MSLPQFCMKDFDFILEVSDINKYHKQESGSVMWFNKGCPSEGCCGISAAIGGTARRNSTHSNCCSHDCSCHAITQMPHLPCDLQDTLFLTGNQFQWSPEKKKSISNCNLPSSICKSDLSIQPLKNVHELIIKPLKSFAFNTVDKNKAIRIAAPTSFHIILPTLLNCTRTFESGF